jgi:hypothetical protein
MDEMSRGRCGLCLWGSAIMTSRLHPMIRPRAGSSRANIPNLPLGTLLTSTFARVTRAENIIQSVQLRRIVFMR